MTREIKSSDEARLLFLFNLSRCNTAKEETSHWQDIISAVNFVFFFPFFCHSSDLNLSEIPDGVSSHLDGNINYSQSVTNSWADVRAITHLVVYDAFPSSAMVIICSV